MKKILSLSILTLALGVSSSALAAGYQLSEYSATGLGRAFAGAGLVGDDYSAIGYNPAGMAVNEKSGMQIGATYVGIRSNVNGSDTFAMDASNPSSVATGYTRSGTASPYITRVLPEAFGQYNVNDRTTIGIGIYAPFGLATDYKNSWFGNSHALRSEILGYNISPSISYQPIDWLTVGASLNIQYASAKITNKAQTWMDGLGAIYAGDLKQANLKGDDWGVGYTVGVMVEPIKNTRLGVSYRSKITHKLEGTLDVTGTPQEDITAKITTPEMVWISGYHQLTEKLGLSATARWTKWSRFHDLNIHDASNGAAVSKTEENWESTWFYALGADYALTDELTFRVGGAYDEPAVKSSSNRTARIPDARRWWASVGASYARDNWQFDIGYSHLFVKAVEATHGAVDSSDFKAKYSSNANLVSVNIQYKF